MNELERRPTKYIKKLFKFLTDEGFGRNTIPAMRKSRWITKRTDFTS